jgi:intracellular multiplication protein IcmL
MTASNEAAQGVPEQLSQHAEENSVDCRVSIEETLAELTSRLHQTADAVAPAARMENERRRIGFISVSSIKLNYILAVGLSLSLVLNCVLGWFAVHPDRQYFASHNGRIFPLIPMSQPYRKAADVIQYAKDTINRSFTLDFLNWRQQLEDTRQNYTRDGFKSFISSLQTSGVLDTVRNRRMNMSITAGTGVLTKEGVENSIHVWYVEVPIEVKLSGQTLELPSQRFLATVRVERVSTLDSIEGIGVSQLVTKPL